MSVTQNAPDDRALIDQSAMGDAAAFDQLMRRHQATVFRFIGTLGVTGDDAEDVLQETFIAAWRGARTYRGLGDVRSWLFSVARHAAHHHLRRRVGEPTSMLSLDDLALRAGWGEQASNALTEQPDARECVERGLARLSDDERQILVLRDIEGLSGEETARVLDLSVAAMKSRLHRSRLHLAAVLKEQHDE